MVKIRVVIVPPGEPARAADIENTLKAMQAVVGGYIELHGLGNDIAVVCNEDGVAEKLPENGCGMLGPYFFTKHDQAGKSVSLTQGDVDACLAYLATYRGVRHGGSANIEIHGFDSFEEFEEFRERRRFEDEHRN